MYNTVLNSVKLNGSSDTIDFANVFVGPIAAVKLSHKTISLDHVFSKINQALKYKTLVFNKDVRVTNSYISKSMPNKKLIKIVPHNPQSFQWRGFQYGNNT